MDPNPTTLVADQLREDIRLGRLLPGTVLRQDALAERFGVSRQPVRLALQSLRASGLVAVRPDRSVEIVGLTREAVRELMQVRLVVEREALALAIPRRAERNVLEAKHLQARLEIEADPQRIEELDCAFHSALYQPCGNSRLLQLIEELRRENRRPYEQQPVGSKQRAQLSRQHRSLLRSYAAGDAPAALAALDDHLRATTPE
jgi:DNA-binding GntR family transcriptional regulator